MPKNVELIPAWEWICPNCGSLNHESARDDCEYPVNCTECNRNFDAVEPAGIDVENKSEELENLMVCCVCGEGATRICIHDAATAKFPCGELLCNDCKHIPGKELKRKQASINQ